MKSVKTIAEAVALGEECIVGVDQQYKTLEGRSVFELRFCPLDYDNKPDPYPLKGRVAIRDYYERYAWSVEGKLNVFNGPKSMWLNLMEEEK